MFISGLKITPEICATVLLIHKTSVLTVINTPTNSWQRTCKILAGHLRVEPFSQMFGSNATLPNLCGLLRFKKKKNEAMCTRDPLVLRLWPRLLTWVTSSTSSKECSFPPPTSHIRQFILEVWFSICLKIWKHPLFNEGSRKKMKK